MIYGVGVDVVNIARFREKLLGTPRLLAKLFAESELQYCLGEDFADTLDDMRTRTDADISTVLSSLAAARLAARFAVKEAVIKALGGGIAGFAWHDIVTVRDSHGAPAITLSGGLAKTAEEYSITNWRVSISHDDPVAAAFVVAETYSQ